MKRTARYAWSVLFLLTFCLLTARAIDKPVKPAPKVKAPLKLTFLRVSPEPAGFGYLALEFRLSNPTKTEVPYSGYLSTGYSPPLKKGIISPLYKIEYQRNGKWEQYRIGWCGTGLGPVAINPNESPKFTVPVYIVTSQPTGKWDAVRIGVSWHSKAEADKVKWKVLWSKPILRKQLAEFEKK